MKTRAMVAMNAGVIVLVAWIAIAVAAPAAMAQCCRCDFNGQPSSCNTGFPDQASCEQTCSELSSTFGQFQACAPGMVWGGCSQDLSTYCDVICVAPAPGVAPAPAMSTIGTFIVVVMLVALGAYTLRRRRRPMH